MNKKYLVLLLSLAVIGNSVSASNHPGTNLVLESSAGWSRLVNEENKDKFGGNVQIISSMEGKYCHKQPLDKGKLSTFVTYHQNFRPVYNRHTDSYYNEFYARVNARVLHSTAYSNKDLDLNGVDVVAGYRLPASEYGMINTSVGITAPTGEGQFWGLGGGLGYNVAVVDAGNHKLAFNAAGSYRYFLSKKDKEKNVVIPGQSCDVLAGLQYSYKKLACDLGYNLSIEKGKRLKGAENTKWNRNHSVYGSVGFVSDDFFCGLGVKQDLNSSFKMSNKEEKWRNILDMTSLYVKMGGSF